MKENVAKPEIVSAFIDVGVDKPHNLAITAIDVKPQVVAANKPIEFTVMLEATGSVQENTVRVRFTNDEAKPMTQAVKVEPGAPKEITFRRSEGLPPGLYQAEITPCKRRTPWLPPTIFVISRFGFARPQQGACRGRLPLRPRRARRARHGSHPQCPGNPAGLWRLSLESTGWYSCDYATTRTFIETKAANLASYGSNCFRWVDQSIGRSVETRPLITWNPAAVKPDCWSFPALTNC